MMDGVLHKSICSMMPRSQCDSSSGVASSWRSSALRLRLGGQYITVAVIMHRDLLNRSFGTAAGSTLQHGNHLPSQSWLHSNRGFPASSAVVASGGPPRGRLVIRVSFLCNAASPETWLDTSLLAHERSRVASPSTRLVLSAQATACVFQLATVLDPSPESESPRVPRRVRSVELGTLPDWADIDDFH